jgi:LacI family transcriptional regulator
MFTTRDKVAKLAHVSPMTVSRVFSGKTPVASKTLDRVLRAAQRCNYTPHAGARALRKGQFNRVALAVVQYGTPGMGYSPTMQGYMDAAAYELAQHGYSLVLEPLYLNLADEYIQPPRLFSELGMDGVLGLPVGGLVNPLVDEQLKRLGCPVVWMNRNPSEEVFCIRCDERANGRALARHLVDLGHTRIGYIGFDSPHYSARQRFEGVRSVLEESGLDTSYLIMSPRHPCMNQLVENLLDRVLRPTAAICYIGNTFDTLVQHCSRRGIRIPADLSICYFASAWEVLWKDYKATMLEVPEKEMAGRAVNRLLDIIQGREESTVGDQPLTGVFHPGWTTARPGEFWPENVPRCRHDDGLCVVKSER